MDFFFTYNVLFGLIFVAFTLFLRYCWNFRKKFNGFPLYHFLPHMLFCSLTGKLPKDVPLTSIIFQKLIDAGKQHAKEGLFMIYTSRPALFIYSEEGTKFFINDKAATDKSPEYLILQEFMGKGMNTSDGQRWKTHRKMINPVFHTGMLKEKVPLFNQHALNLVKDLETLAGTPSTGVLEALKSHYFNALSESIFGLKQSKDHREEHLKLFQIVNNMSGMVVKRMIYPFLGWKFVGNILPFGREFSRTIKSYKSFVIKMISDMQKIDRFNNMKDSDYFSDHLHKSFTYILLNHHLNDPTFTFDDVYDEVSTILITGYEGITHSTLWCLFMLGLHPEIQEKAFNEIQSMTGSYITYEETCSLTYLESVIMETLRLYPNVPIFSRNLSKDVQFGNYKVSKNTTIAFFPYLLHRDPEIYPDPEKFEPERFLNGESKRTWSFIPFSEGSRSCIGKKYALIEMKIFLAHILRNFKITSCDRREDVSFCWTIGLIPAKHLTMKITPRQGKCT